MRRYGRASPHVAGLALAITVSSPAFACINSFGTDKHGHQFDSMDYTGEDLAEMLTSKRNRSYWVTNAGNYGKAAIEQPSYENATNLGVSLIYREQYAAAIRLFLRLERIYPGRPQTAANLGTALELAGQDAVALKWIRLGIRRDRGEHEGTEWLHARILQAKIANAEGRWDRKRSIAGVAYAEEPIPAIPKAMPAGNDGKPVKPHELDRAFRYQLNERMKFVAPKDWVVANLLMDWATLNLAGGPVENAKVLHGLARRYGQPATVLWSQRLARIDRILAKPEAATPSEGGCAICAPPPLPPPPPTDAR